MSVSELQRQTAIMRAWNAGSLLTPTPGTATLLCLPIPPSQMTGYTAEELHGCRRDAASAPRYRSGGHRTPAGLLERRALLEGSTTNYRKDGTPYVVRWNISPSMTKTASHHFCLVQDISRLHRIGTPEPAFARALDASHDLS